MKTYDADLIANIQLSKLPITVLLIKNRTDCDTEAWYYLIKFMNAARRQIKQCTMYSMFDNNQALFFLDGVRKADHESKKHKKTYSNNVMSDTHANPPHNKRTSTSDIFGSDSDEEQLISAKPSKKPPPPINSYFNKRVANGVSRQSDLSKIGSHFIELKVYNCDEIRNIQPMNRWRHAIITIKNQTSDNTEAWEHLTQFIKATRKEFKDCPLDLFGGSGAYSYS